MQNNNSPMRIVAVHNEISTTVLKKNEKMRSRKKIRNIMDQTRRLEKKGIMKKTDRGVYSMNYNKRQERLLKKFELSKKKGCQIEIIFKNENGKIQSRKCVATDKYITEEGNTVLTFTDRTKNGYRSARLDRVTSINI